MAKTQFTINERNAVVGDGIQGHFWTWLCEQLDNEAESAIITLTTLDKTPDNIGKVAAALERLAFAKQLKRRPYDILGIPEPR